MYPSLFGMQVKLILFLSNVNLFIFSLDTSNESLFMSYLDLDHDPSNLGKSRCDCDIQNYIYIYIL